MKNKPTDRKRELKRIYYQKKKTSICLERNFKKNYSTIKVE